MPEMILSINTDCPARPPGGARYPRTTGPSSGFDSRAMVPDSAPRTGPVPGHGGTGMTLEIGSQKVGRIGRRGSRMAPSLSIGEIDANIFACPACSRPLDSGTRRCPGCATHLLAGVKASRAIGFVFVGGLAGTLLGGGLVAAISFLGSRPVEVVVAPAPAVVRPSQAPIASAPAPAVDPAIPSSALSALRQSTLLNQRVLDDAARLTAALATTKPSS